MIAQLETDTENTSPRCPFSSGSVSTAGRLGQALTCPAAELGNVNRDEAEAFLHLLHCESSDSAYPIESRLEYIHRSLQQTGSYAKTSEELAEAARIAWRNNIRCIGRLHWRSLEVRDLRHLDQPDDVFEALVEHLRLATNDGAIQPMMSIFSREPQGAQNGVLRIINHQLIRYACYRQKDALLGDPANLLLTDLAIKHGWKPPQERSAFDVLPILITDHQRRIHVYDLPRDPEVVLEVPLRHPSYEWFEKLNLRWHAVPAISDMVLDAGGLKYPANAFNGWYMSTEIAARNLADVHRYNLLPVIAEHMGLSSRNERTLWKDRALVELNQAVLYSYEKDGVRLVDHHTASKQFLAFTAKEHTEGREVNGDWTWLTPPVSGCTSPLFHRSYPDEVVKPGFFYLEPS